MSVSIFDGLPLLPTVTPTHDSAAGQNVALTFMTVMSATQNPADMEVLLAKSKLSYQVIQDLVKRYHKAFLSLYKHAEHKIDQLNREVQYLKNPVKVQVMAATFTPKPATMNEDMGKHITDAFNLGIPLTEHLANIGLLC